jgi:hypothetical protein
MDPDPGKILNADPNPRTWPATYREQNTSVRDLSDIYSFKKVLPSAQSFLLVEDFLTELEFFFFLSKNFADHSSWRQCC